jgi:hypothetical protein
MIELNLNTNQISDLSPLSGLTDMIELDLNRNQISDLSPLVGLTNLTSLQIGINQISDLSPLSGLTNLTTLTLQGNPLNRESYCDYIPTIQNNNPGVNLTADPNPYNCDDNTPTGENVEVAPVDENSPTGATPLTLTFQSVTESGNTTLATSDSGPPPPTGLKLLGTYYEINTTAVVVGPIQIALEYDDTGLTPRHENNLKLRCYDEMLNDWVDITTGVDTENNVIYGVTEHFSFFVVVYNVPPEIGFIDAPLDPVQVNTTVEAFADFLDPDATDTHTADWDWGDGSTSEGTVGPGTVTGSHVYTTAGVYTVVLTITDNAGDLGEAAFEYVVIYNPDAGFVTGGGWIDSPAGAYPPDPSLVGKANFGFVSKYKTGVSEPTGQTEFVFKMADVNFHSNSYDWLVVTGSDYAKFKGEGTINGAGAYKFQVWAGDGGPDTFTIKIWTEDNLGNETIEYWNDMDHPIEGGSIIVHEK